MLSRLTGVVIEKQPPYLVLEVQGVGYELQMPMNCFYQLPALGEATVLFTHHWIREDAQLLYGFKDRSARTLFRSLIKVNGVGPKLALAILSGLSVPQFIFAVERNDPTLLIKLPGVGKKTAERLIIEMRDRCQDLAVEPLEYAPSFKGSAVTAHLRDSEAEHAAVAALITLGYKAVEAQRLIRQVMQPEMDCETLIRQALRSLG
ncbi:Holliday junction branch migration protein RuvA [unidentified bacterial endosymbiont]|uniref:Holliday junction branch migration protein RuvA n=1 Tax=unidentified bacterial endosymbiont TaxID=2355 RepID=UPI0020A03594|nr:Holliday junction branch migration protein RuvA [unidentified bacterial endosymbiont]